jgi:hypothetical protein
MVAMETLRNKLTLVIIALILLSIYLSVYSVVAYDIAVGHIYEDENGELWWITTPSGSLFPWPEEPGMLEALSSVHDVDIFIYRYLVVPRLIFWLPLVSWLFTAISVYMKFGRR